MDNIYGIIKKLKNQLEEAEKKIQDVNAELSVVKNDVEDMKVK